MPRYFEGHDDGIHVLAHLLYRALESSERRGVYDDFVVRQVREDAIGNGLEAAFAAAPGHYPMKALE